MKYIALLRGINVGGNRIIKMAELKEAVETGGFTNVTTYIQSGNIIFESDENNPDKVTEKLEETLLKRFEFNTGIIVKTFEQFEKIVKGVPADWKYRTDLRCYMAFVKGQGDAEEVVREIKLKEGVDTLVTGEGVLYMSTILSGLTKSGFTKLVGTKIYKEITIRNYNTVRKILAIAKVA
jgi:uncharacterized protein (DUF1697 family)